MPKADNITAGFRLLAMDDRLEARRTGGQAEDAGLRALARHGLSPTF